jgi:hypothetical protein
VKWQLDQPSIIARAKADVKPFPFGLTNGDTDAHICQRTHQDAFTMINPITTVETAFADPVLSDGYKRLYKVRVRMPGESDLNRHFWSKPWRHSYGQTFPTDFDGVEAPDGTYSPWIHGAFPMSDPMVVFWRQNLGGSPVTVVWEMRSYAMQADGTYEDDVVVFTGRPDISDEHDVWPKYAYKPTRSCRRVLVWDNIAHDGETYPDAILRAPAGTEPPDGPIWRMRPKSKLKPESSDWNQDSDLRFEPWAWPATGFDELRRFVAAWWDGSAELPIASGDSTGAHLDGFADVTCEHIEGVADPINARFSGQAIFAGLQRQAALLGKDFVDQVPAGLKHALLVDAEIWTITEWQKASAEADLTRVRPWALLGIYGRAAAIV